jgi:hypothetical protein
MAEREGARKSSVPIVVCTAPDICKTPVGNSTPPIPYQIIANFQDSEAVSSDVRFGGDPAFMLDQSFISQVTGDEPGTAGGVRSGVNKSIAKPVEASSNVRANKRRVVRNNDAFEMNNGNTSGICIYQSGSGPACKIDSKGKPTGDTNPTVRPDTQAAQDAAQEGKGLWSKASPIVHGVLGVASFIPGVSIVAGALDAGVYLGEGSYDDAFLAGLGMFPGGKVATTAGKIVKGASKAGKIAKTAKLAKKGELTASELKAANALRQMEKQVVRGGETATTASAAKADDVIRTGNGTVTITARRGIKERKVLYTKRDREEYERLRKEFDSTERKKFVQDLANDPNKATQLREAGFSDTDIAKIKAGKMPGEPGEWQVHHKLPLDDGGTNVHDNLVLIKNNPYHQELTNAQRTLTNGLKVGESRAIKWPVPDGFIYPPK